MGEEIAAELTPPRFVISAEEAKRFAAAAREACVEDFLPSLVPEVVRWARAPISRFPVGAVGLGASGRAYLAANLEFPGLPLSHTVHAEQFLLASAVVAGETGLRRVAVYHVGTSLSDTKTILTIAYHVPCDHSCQFFQEVRGADNLFVRVTSKPRGGMWHTAGNLSPLPFRPADLLPKNAPRLLEPHDSQLGSLAPVFVDFRGAVGVVVWLLREADEKAARRAHAPYSGCTAGFVVADGEGRVYAGGCMESAAYNPTLGPVQEAMVAMVAAGSGAPGEVVAAALVEQRGAVVAYEATARVFLAAVAPLARLHAFHYQPSDA